jgi:hypothetical protein
MAMIVSSSLDNKGCRGRVVSQFESNCCRSGALAANPVFVRPGGGPPTDLLSN